MILRRVPRIVVVCLVLAIMGSSGFALIQARQSYDPARQRPTRQPGDSFIDSVLKRINPSDRNYGQCIDEAQKFVLQETVEHGYFWSNMIALSLLGCFFVIIVYQHNRHTRREWIVAEVLQQYEHALARANARVDEATKRNHELAEELASFREATIRSSLPLLESADRREPKASSKTLTEVPPAGVTSRRSGPMTASPEAIKAVGSGAKFTSQIPLFKPEVDLIVKVNSLEQQLGRSQEQEKQLRRQLNQSELRLQTEQQKNRTLKGE